MRKPPAGALAITGLSALAGVGLLLALRRSASAAARPPALVPPPDEPADPVREPTNTKPAAPKQAPPPPPPPANRPTGSTQSQGSIFTEFGDLFKNSPSDPDYGDAPGSGPVAPAAPPIDPRAPVGTTTNPIKPPNGGL